MTKDKNDYQFLPDTNYEGKGSLFLDVDRFINEGLSGGSVHMRDDTTNIGQATLITDHEEPPAHS
ncbi:hypothetical protein HP456_06385 [Bacillus haikouensis]|jgi:hypothetical protein|uniref:hypothetical protein n=1 Tax=Bacillus haikouensis TaxID=1510468 RepID=UPI001551AE4F|nr:hypothetical protein [Bacillus haikouensis]NQD65548.1 hypothetical protein [Bacillus haikouensis]